MGEPRTAFVTGASSGLGRSLAERLAAGGARVVLAARREELLEEVRRGIVDAGGAAEVQPLDVSDPGAARAAVRHWDAELGGLDLVLANAGIGRVDRADRLGDEEVDDVLRVNALGAIATLHAAARPMVERGSGTLVGMSSLAGMRGLPASGAYSASKAALSTWLETLRIDLAPRGVRVVDVRPGFVRTAMTAENRFPMPFLMDLPRATDRALEGILRGRAIVAFPWPMATVMRVVERLPAPVWRWMARRAAPGEG